MMADNANVSSYSTEFNAVELVNQCMKKSQHQKATFLRTQNALFARLNYALEEE